MDRDQILEWTTAERLGVADLLDDLGDHEWRSASLCPGWTVRDVAAHLTMSTRDRLFDTIRGVVRARGDFNRMLADQARERAARFAPEELVAQLRETAGSARRMPGSSLLDPLVDALVHGLDIARPLGRRRQPPTPPVLAGLDHVRRSSFYGGPRRFRGTRLVATDADWSAGAGPAEVRGPAADLLLLATGRPAALPHLSGPGLDRIAATL